jgi:predicted ribosome quality control (RQC) complex YloA/Tae2 family protein
MKTIVLEFEQKNGQVKPYKLLIGENQAENDLIIRQSHQNDTWFHLENLSSPHFVLQNEGDPIQRKNLNVIASMFRDYKNGLGLKYSVIYTQVKNLRLTQVAGQVKTSNLKIIKI